MPFYRPTCRVRLQIRLDELDDTGGLSSLLSAGPGVAGVGSTTPATKAGAQDALAANQAARTSLNQSRATMPATELDKERARLDKERTKLQRVALGGFNVQERPDSLLENTNDRRNLIFDTLARSVEICRNPLQDADTATVTLDFRDLPIDPRAVRAVLVSVMLGTVSADDWAHGIAGQRRGDGSLVSMVGREPGQELKFRSSSKYVGFAEEFYVEHTDGGSEVRLTCRDISALLRDQRLGDERIDLTKPIVLGIQELVNKYVLTKGMRVRFGWPNDPDDPLNTIIEDPTGPLPVTAPGDEESPIPVDASPRTRKSRKGQARKSTRRGNDRESVWDHVLKVCVNSGLVPVVRGFTLYVLPPRTVFTGVSNKRIMVWGLNLKRLEFARKLGGLKTPSIEVRCSDPDIGRTRWARFPVLKGEPTSGIIGKAGSPQPTISRANNVSPSGEADEEFRVLTVRGVNDQKRLETIARNAYETISRQEIEGAFETDDLDSFDSREEADLLDLYPGDPVELAVARPATVRRGQGAAEQPSDVSSEYQRAVQQNVAERASYLQSLGFSAETAQRLAQAQEQVRLTRDFRAKHVNISFDVDDGVKIESDFENYIYVRDDVITAKTRSPV